MSSSRPAVVWQSSGTCLSLDQQSSGSHSAVIQQSSGSHRAEIRQTSGSHPAVVWQAVMRQSSQSSGSRPAVVWQSPFKLKTHHQSKYRFLFLHHFLLQSHQFRHFPQFFDYFFLPRLEFRFQFLQRLLLLLEDGLGLFRFRSLHIWAFFKVRTF